MSKGKKITARIFGVLGFLLLVAIALGVGIALKIMRTPKGEHTGAGSSSLWQQIQDFRQVAISPKEGFPGKDRLIILCMGIDDNWTDKDEVYTAGSRTDTLFLLSLDLVNKKAAMLSIPRDTYAHIAGTKDRYFKINEAYSTGGPQRSIDTVAELLGVHADHYMVLNIDATKKMVDALGGVDVDVPHEMHYHDKWGHLSIDLMPGQQHLDGDQAVGFARYRHPDAGKKATPEDGDERRMARQHILLRAMVDRGKSFANVAQAPHLIDVGMSSIRTDLTRTQLFDLAAIYRGIQPDAIQTASLTGDDFRGPNGEWFYRIDKIKAAAYTDWLVRGDETAARRLVTVVVKNGTNRPGLAQRVVDALKTNGYTDVQNGGNASKPVVRLTSAPTTNTGPAHSSLLDTGVPYSGAAQDIASLLGLSDATMVRRPVQPNHLGWTPPTTLTLTLGKDYALAVAQADKVTGDVEDPSARTTVKQN
jgi:LCP family protein required for cell wall assembly